MDYCKIKQVCTNRFEIALTQINDKYMIEYINTKTDERQSSVLMEDYQLASYIFELKIDELIGN